MTKSEFIKRANEAPRGGFVGDLLRGDNEGLDWRWGLAGTPIAEKLISIPNHIYGRHIIKDVDRGAQAQSTFDSLVGRAKKEGTPVNFGSKPPHYNPGDGSVNMPYTKGHSGYYGSDDPFMSMFMGPKKPFGRHADPAVLAHEMGHAHGGKALGWANAIGKYVGGLGAGITGFAATNEGSQNGANIGTAGLGVTMLSELDASRRGYRMMRNHGHNRTSSLRSFVGIPTYALSMAAPQLLHSIKERMGGFDKQ
jgi:hypothetical protein